MRKDRVAEWILQLVCARERAESTVGDLVETAATRGEVWFWASVWRTAASLFWQGLTSDPREILRLAFRGFLLNLSLLAVFFLGFAAPGTTMHRILSFFSFIVSYICHLEVGCWVARRAPGRELQACMATIFLPMAVGTYLLLAFALDTNEPQGSAMFDVMLNQIPCLLGAILVRKRATS